MDTPVRSKDADGREILDSVVIRFAGDSGDGMQLAGMQFTQTTAVAGNDLATFPDFPAEIRAPAGTTFGVSGFQIHFASHDVLTPGDEPDVLVAMNPAALKVNLRDVPSGGLIILNTGAFTPQNLKKAGYEKNPLEDGTLDPYRKLEIDVSKLVVAAVEPFGLGTKEALRAKNVWTLGLLYWLFGRDRTPTIEWLKKKFAKRPDIAEANIAALNAGHVYGETAELPTGVAAYKIPKADLPRGHYRNITGNEALAWGLATAGRLAELPVFYGSYPITPASSVLHSLAGLKHYGVTTFQAEDEIAAICSAIGASYAGIIGATATSGPGMALKGEAMGLAIMTELPLVIFDVQRAGPSTGMPTKTEQSDLFQAVWGRNGDAPLVVLAPATPGECFYMAIEAVRLAIKYMTPVIVLSDGYIANGAEPWAIPSFADLPKIPVAFRTDPAGFHPYVRDPETLARNWAKPGTPGLEHRIGGIEKNFASGHISYDPENHQKMTKTRADKVLGVAKDLPLQKVEIGNERGKMVVVGWGSTYGSIHQAVRRARKDGLDVSHVHVRHLWPLPSNLADLLGGFERVLVPELNNGQLVRLLRAEYLIPADPMDKISGMPFRVAELEQEIRAKLAAPPVRNNRLS
ncbi:MAG: 2-oxoacid:acceptor oxidoreductase subunit alpha [Nannocystaceae bacterium]|nr:2-oxoacid:acceptor oxidoreductase subunit alpha [Deltaproteobacteria bacterium]MBK8715185.1 2-oxoacid:acceptor oxidoreductase subunit alpha [Deltaproteobacteria bacterium]MBP7285109.1 2-oxoacid:acceptor oxidoreductase subunit alpha [Nannocystaceae bacterium]